MNGVQVGVVSWSVKPCAVAPYPGVYTDISKISFHTEILDETNFCCGFRSLHRLDFKTHWNWVRS